MAQEHETQDPHIKAILTYWFGPGGEADLPTRKMTKRWFGHSKSVDEEIAQQFEADVKEAIEGKKQDWTKIPRGSLALILLLDQFPRKIYRDTPQAFAYDTVARTILETGLDQSYDHSLSLIERVFYYMPLLHAEDLALQEQSVAAYESLLTLALPETSELFKTFLAIAIQHFEVIQKFSRFPERNEILGRKSTESELVFLEDLIQP